MVEQVYYDDGTVRITATRATFAHKTYVMKNITSVGAVVIRPRGERPLAMILLGLLFVLLGLGCGSFPMGALGALATAVGVLWLVMQKQRYAVEICTAAGEFQALVSKNEDRIDEVIKALHQAIRDQG